MVVPQRSIPTLWWYHSGRFQHYGGTTAVDSSIIVVPQRSISVLLKRYSNDMKTTAVGSSIIVVPQRSVPHYIGNKAVDSSSIVVPQRSVPTLYRQQSGRFQQYRGTTAVGPDIVTVDSPRPPAPAQSPPRAPRPRPRGCPLTLPPRGRLRTRPEGPSRHQSPRWTLAP